MEDYLETRERNVAFYNLQNGLGCPLSPLSYPSLMVEFFFLKKLQSLGLSYMQPVSLAVQINSCAIRICHHVSTLDGHRDEKYRKETGIN